MSRPNVELIGESDETPRSLLDRVKANDPAAYDELVCRYGPLVRDWCHRDGLQPADAEDVCQEVFLAVLHKIADFHGDQAGDTFRGWLWTITRHKIDDWRRRRQRRPEPGPLSETIPAPSHGEEPFPETDDRAELVQRAEELIAQDFTGRTAEAVRRVVDGEEPGAVAKELGMTLDGIRQAKRRVLSRLREELGAEAMKRGQPRGEKPSGGPGPTDQPNVKGSPDGGQRRPEER